MYLKGCDIVIIEYCVLLCVDFMTFTNLYYYLRM